MTRQDGVELNWHNVKGVKKVRSTIKLYSYYFDYNVYNGLNATGIL